MAVRILEMNDLMAYLCGQLFATVRHHRDRAGCRWVMGYPEWATILRVIPTFEHSSRSPGEPLLFGLPVVVCHGGGRPRVVPPERYPGEWVPVSRYPAWV